MQRRSSNESAEGTPAKSILHHSEPSDVQQIRQAAHYSHYALGVYDQYPDALLRAGLISSVKCGVFNPSGANDDICLSSCFRLTDLGLPDAVLVYCALDNGILQTPYFVIVDESKNTVIVSIRGSVTLEDLVTDMQFSSVELERVGERCGFEGKRMYAHRGMLAKCKWIYNDLTR